ncbi:hypothetical protein KKA14_01770 [bacterium]|nr:hypothetical protein [bacterium]
MSKSDSNHFFRKLAGFKDVFQVPGKGRALYPEKFGNAILRQPDRLIMKNAFGATLGNGGG